MSSTNPSDTGSVTGSSSAHPPLGAPALPQTTTATSTTTSNSQSNDRAVTAQQQQAAAALGGMGMLAKQQQQQQQQALVAAKLQQQQQQQQLTRASWHDQKHRADRSRMIQQIVKLLSQRKPDAPSDWLKKLPQMATRLEDQLYKKAASFEAYNDITTLKQRLQQLAMDIGARNQLKQQRLMQQKKQQQMQQQQELQRQQQVASSQVVSNGLVNNPLDRQQVQQQPPKQPQQQIVNMNEINSMLTSQSQPSLQQQQQTSSVGQDSRTALPTTTSNNFSTSAPANGVQVPAPPVTSSKPSTNSRSSSDRQQVLRHQQQRLLLLRHAAKCPHEDGNCPVTPHCAGMKKLWKHIAECKNQKCVVPHCVSSRYVLSHYHRCKDVRCPVCGPVREAIHRSHEKAKQMQALKLKHDDALNQNRGVQNQHVLSSGDNNDTTTKRPRRDASVAGPTGNHISVPIPGQAAVNVKGQIGQNGQVISAPFRPSGPKPKEDHTLLTCFTVDQIENHIASLKMGLQLPPQKLKIKALDVMKILQSHQHGWVFNTPVDPIELGLPDYFEIIKNPMDLGTIKKRLDNGCYHSLEDFEADVNLTFDNAMTYNSEGSVVHNMAKEMKALFHVEHNKLLQQVAREDAERRQSGDACTLCGCEKLLFEPPTFYCCGANCGGSVRIRRNSYYYVYGKNQYHLCHQCWGELRDDQAISTADATFYKRDMKKLKNDDSPEESWVQCDKCERWVHQICAMFNTRQNKHQQSEYTCPHCTIEERKARGITGASSKIPMAEDLSRTKMSEFIEKHVREKVDEYFTKAARDKASVENITLQEAEKVVRGGGPITIRQVTSVERKMEVFERMKKRYSHKNYPSEFPFRSKCIVVFQRLDGVDVILFGLYVYEHGAENPVPNKRSVYVSYLDSVHFMVPRRMRTLIYHEILISYLDYVRRRGFATAHIWACPPLKGDDYILHAKPEDQKTPKDDRLRLWYIDMLEKCQVRDIVGRVTNMYDLYFTDERNDATIVPYFHGDYFPGEVENIIKDMEEGGGKKGSTVGKKSKKKGEKKKGHGRSGTRSSGLDGEDLPEGFASKSLQEGGRDYVMKKLGDTIKPMKEAFIVAYLNCSDNSEANRVIPENLVAKRNEYLQKYPPAPLLCHPVSNSDSENDDINVDVEGGKNVNCDSTTSNQDVPSSSKKRDGDGQVKVNDTITPKKEEIKIIDDDQEEMESEILNERQLFLDLCRQYHYQFDQLRRAKHTSMMVLWFLHNRDAPKYVQQCAVCSRDILTGIRYNCTTCQDYDLCPDCVHNPNTPRHPHPLKPVPVGNKKATEAQRRERQQQIQLHMKLLQHAATCNSPNCPSANCTKMKGLLKHGQTCQIKRQGGCNVCKRIWVLLQFHARQCKLDKCPVPQCNALREKVRQLSMEQRAMDDRRRRMMNATYAR